MSRGYITYEVKRLRPEHARPTLKLSKVLDKHHVTWAFDVEDNHSLPSKMIMIPLEKPHTNIIHSRWNWACGFRVVLWSWKTGFVFQQANGSIKQLHVTLAFNNAAKDTNMIWDHSAQYTLKSCWWHIVKSLLTGKAYIVYKKFNSFKKETKSD